MLFRSSSTQTFTVVVNPTPVLSVVPSQTVCAGSGVNAINFIVVPVGASVGWSNTNTNIGIAANGTGNISGYTSPIVVTQQTGVITAIPADAATGCVGLPQTFTVVINPSPTISGGVIDSALCGANNGGVDSILVAGGTPLYHYQWYNGSTPMTNDRSEERRVGKECRL